MSNMIDAIVICTAYLTINIPWFVALVVICDKETND
jgi:hypothetical protein